MDSAIKTLNVWGQNSSKLSFSAFSATPTCTVACIKLQHAAALEINGILGINRKSRCVTSPSWLYRGASVSISGKWWGADRSSSGLPRPTSWSGATLQAAPLSPDNKQITIKNCILNQLTVPNLWFSSSIVPSNRRHNHFFAARMQS